MKLKSRKIVRRTYSVLNGKKSKVVNYAVSPKDATGAECFHSDIEKAHLFHDDMYFSYKNQSVAGNDRYGDFSYRQEILEVKLIIE